MEQLNRRRALEYLRRRFLQQSNTSNKGARAIMRFVPLLCISVLLLFTYRLYADSYFSTDDFNNLYWAQQQTAGEMTWHVLNPFSRSFRPTGMMFYWLLFHFFDLNAPAYHWVAWLIHGANTALVYLILKTLTNSAGGAAVGAMLFASQSAFADIYWSFGTIFELVCACFFFAGILLWTREQRTWTDGFALFLLFLVAIKAKEMAITLPALWLAYEVLIRRNFNIKTLARRFILPASVAIWYGLTKFGDMREPNRSDLYYMDIRWITVGREYGGYFNALFHTRLRWQYWAIGFVAVLLFLLIKKFHVAAFFQTYVFVTFLPVIFLVNHRELYLAYIPFLGLCGLAALLTKAVTRDATVFAIFPLLCWGTYLVQRNGSETARALQKPIPAEYRAFVSGIRALPPPAPSETIFFDSRPLHFNESLLRYATQVALRRTDIDVKLVTEPPPDARFRLHFENLRLMPIGTR